MSDYFSHRLLLLSFITTCVQREDDKRFHVREELDEIHLLYSVSFSDTFGWPSLLFAVYVMFTFQLSAKWTGRTNVYGPVNRVLENATLEHLDVSNVVCVEMAKRVIL